MNALAVMPWTCSPTRVVMIVTPVANIPSVLRSATRGSSPSISRASARGPSSNGVSPIPSGPAVTATPDRGRLNSGGGSTARS